MGFQGKNIFITGASAGIGAALAREFAAQGANLILVARRLDRLNALKASLGGRATRIECYGADVARAEDLAHVVSLSRSAVGPVDVVIANAGFGVVGNFETLTEEDFRRQFETNVFGAMRTLRATLSDLKRTKGNFCVIGSVNGYLPLPGNSAYSMSKFAVRAWCESLGAELAPYGISVTHIAPGFIATEFRQVDNYGTLHLGAKDRVPAWIQMPATTAARQIVSAISRRRREKVVTYHGKFVTLLVRFFPGLVSFLIRRLGITARPEPA